MSRNLVALLGLAWGLTALACAGQKNTTPPPIRVNQQGLAERIAQTASASSTDTNKQSTALQTTAADDKGDDKADNKHSSSTAAEQEEGGTYPGIIREDPSPSKSADRVAFQRVEEEKVQDQDHAPSPVVDFDALRDSRTQKFRHRENARGR